MSKNMHAIPNVGMPAARRYFPSLAPVDIVGTTGNPGHIVANVSEYAVITSRISGDGGTVTTGIALPSEVLSTTIVTFTPESFATRSNVFRTSSGSSPGKIRQLTVARAICGSAFGAWPPASIVATHVVLSSEL